MTAGPAAGSALIQRVALIALTSIAALLATACGGSSKSKNASKRTSKNCAALIGIEAPTTGKMAWLGKEQVAFAKIAVANDNKANGTRISLVDDDTQLAMATTATEQMIGNADIVAVVGPATSREVETVGPLFGRAGMAFISGSATSTALTDGANPTFFRVVPKDSLQGGDEARFVIRRLHPKGLMIVDDGSAYSTGLLSAMIPIFRAARVAVYRESLGEKVTNFSSLVAKLTPRTTVAVLPWQVAADAQQFGRTVVEQHKHVTLVGTDRLYSPTSFTVPGAYVSSYGPAITEIRSDVSLIKQAKAALTESGVFGLPVYAATHVVDEAIASVCRSRQTPTRFNVLPAIKSSTEATSALGEPIRFDSHGDLRDAKWFMFHINSAGRYQPIGG